MLLQQRIAPLRPRLLLVGPASRSISPLCNQKICITMANRSRFDQQPVVIVSVVLFLITLTDRMSLIFFKSLQNHNTAVSAQTSDQQSSACSASNTATAVNAPANTDENTADISTSVNQSTISSLNTAAITSTTSTLTTTHYVSSKAPSKVSERAKKKAWYSVLYPSYKSRSEDFKKLFKGVPDDERLVVGKLTHARNKLDNL